MHVLPDALDDNAAKNHVEWSAVEEGFRILERDLGKLQVQNIPLFIPELIRTICHLISNSSK